MVLDLLKRLEDKKISKETLIRKIKQDFKLLPEIIDAMNSKKAVVRYSCGKILMGLSETNPDELYPYFDKFTAYLDSNYRIITWQTMAIIANLIKVDKKKKFDEIFEKYFGFINNEYMVTVANVVGHSGKIAQSKPYLIPKITQKLLSVENIKTTAHLTKECKLVITESAIQSFDLFFEQVKEKEKVISFVKKFSNSSRKTLKKESQDFLKKWT